LRFARCPDLLLDWTGRGRQTNCRPADTARVDYDAVVIEFPMLLNFEFSCSRTNIMAAVTPSEIVAAWSAYSVRSWPSVSRTNLGISVVIEQGLAKRGRPPRTPRVYMAAARTVNSRVKTRP
jgi:hypothetical protein